MLKGNLVVLIAAAIFMVGSLTCRTLDSQSRQSVNQNDALGQKPTNTPLHDIRDGGSFAYKGIHFAFDPRFAENVTAEEKEAVPLEDERYKPDGVEPRHVSVQFKRNNSQRRGGSPFIDVMKFYPIADYEQVLSKSPKYYATVAKDFERLETILKAKSSPIGNDVPYIPFVDASQDVIAHKTRISFMKGCGIGYVTQFNQDIAIINNQKLVYVFEGITADKKYFVLAEFSLTAPFLPNEINASRYQDYEIPEDYYRNLSVNEKRYKQYLSTVQDELERTPGSRFEPELVMFERLLSSLEITGDIFN